MLMRAAGVRAKADLKLVDDPGRDGSAMLVRGKSLTCRTRRFKKLAGL